MTRRTATPPGSASERPLPRVWATQDVAEIQRVLAENRPYAATLYSYLEPRHFSYTRWHLAEGLEEPALMVQVDGLAGASLCLQGGLPGLAAILAQVTPGRLAYITCEARHHPLVSQHFLLRGLQPLVRMAVNQESFHGVPSEATALGPAQINEVNNLYRSDSGALLSRRALADGLYYGLWQGGRLVSIAGTQMLSREHGVAVVANVLTHPQHRGHGYATQCVSGLTAALLEQAPDVVLNVDPGNAPAIRVYQRLGYWEATRLMEAWAIWRGRSPLERLLAAFLHWFSR